MEWAIAILVLSNILTGWLAFRRRPKLSKQVLALQQAVAAFEVEGQTILHITKIAPDSVYLRSVGRR